MASHLGNTFSRRRRIAIIVTLGMLTGLGPFTIDLYLPAFPALKSDLGISDTQVQLTLSATTLGFATGQLLVGPLSDRLGRRLPLIACSILHVVSSILVAVSPTIENVIVLGIIVLIRTFLSFSLEIEIEGVPPWRRGLVSGATVVRHAAQASASQ